VVNFGKLGTTGTGIGYPIVIYAMINSSNNNKYVHTEILRLHIEGEIYSKADDKSTVINYEKFSKVLNLYCPKLNSPCQNIYLAEIVSSYESDYLIKITKTELLDSEHTGRINENVFLNLGIAEMNSKYLTDFFNIKLINFMLAIILVCTVFCMTSSKTKSSASIRKLCISLILFHNPVFYIDQDMFNQYYQYLQIFYWIFYSHLVYFWMSELHKHAFKALNTNQVEDMTVPMLFPKILAIVKQFFIDFS
jgi:hypothetical protein